MATDRNYEIECQMLPSFEIDLSKLLPSEKLAGVPVGGLVPCETIVLEPMEIDARAPVALGLTFPSAAASDLLDLIGTLSVIDRTLGGKGLKLDRSWTWTGDGWLTIALLPIDNAGARERFTRMAEQLGVTLENGPATASPDPCPGDVLADMIARFERGSATEGESLASLNQSCLRPFLSSVRFRLIWCC